MLYILGIFTALQIVAAQTLWKIGLEKIDFTLSKDFLLSSQVGRLVFSPYVIGGALLYATATLIFFAMLSRFNYAGAQTVVVTSSLTFTFLSAAFIFGEQIKPIHLVGIFCLFIGVILITKS